MKLITSFIYGGSLKDDIFGVTKFKLMLVVSF